MLLVENVLKFIDSAIWSLAMPPTMRDMQIFMSLTELKIGTLYDSHTMLNDGYRASIPWQVSQAQCGSAMCILKNIMSCMHCFTILVYQKWKMCPEYYSDTEFTWSTSWSHCFHHTCTAWTIMLTLRIFPHGQLWYNENFLVYLI